MIYDTLEWDIAPVLQNVYDEDAAGKEMLLGQFLHLEVTPIVNGTRVETPWVFDTAEVLARRDIGYHLFDLFTCTCGVAGCAGIHNDVHLRIDTKNVQLQFPRVKPFIENLVPKHFPNTETPLVWTFDAKQYQLASEDLISRLLALEVENIGTPMSLFPEDDYAFSNPAKSIALQLSRAAQYFAEYTADVNENKLYLGPLYQAELKIEIEDDVYTLRVSDVFEAAYDNLVSEQSKDNDENDQARKNWIQKKIVYFRESPQELVAFAKSLSWESFHMYGYLMRATTEHPMVQLKQQWPNIVVTFVPADNPETQDWTLL